MSITGRVCGIMASSQHEGSMTVTSELVNAYTLYLKHIIFLLHRQWEFTDHKDLLWHQMWAVFSRYRWAFLSLHTDRNLTWLSPARGIFEIQRMYAWKGIEIMPNVYEWEPQRSGLSRRMAWQRLEWISCQPASKFILYPRLELSLFSPQCAHHEPYNSQGDN